MDPDLLGLRPEASVLADSCFDDASVYQPVPPVPTNAEIEGNIRLIVESVLFAQNVFDRIGEELRGKILVWETAHTAASAETSTLAPAGDTPEEESVEVEDR